MESQETLEQTLRYILGDFADYRAEDHALQQSTEHTYQKSIARIERAFEKAGYILKEAM